MKDTENNINCKNKSEQNNSLKKNSGSSSRFKESSEFLKDDDDNQLMFGISQNNEMNNNSLFKYIAPKSFSTANSQIASAINNINFSSKLHFQNQTMQPINPLIDNTPMFVNPKQYETILMMRIKKMKRNIHGFFQNRFRRKRVKYESRSRHAKSRKRAKDGKFLPNGGDDCSDNLSNSTFLKETQKEDSISRSRSREMEKDRLLETDSMNGKLSPHDLQRKHIPILKLGRNISSDIFRTYEHNSMIDDELLFDEVKLKEKQNSSFKWNTDKDSIPSEEPKLFHRDSIKKMDH